MYCIYRGDLDSPAGDPSAAVGETVQKKTSPQETKVRRWTYMRNNAVDTAAT